MAGIVTPSRNRRPWKGSTKTPSATSAAMAVICGPSAPNKIGGAPLDKGPGLNIGVMRRWR